jgi:hypothetical protein
MHASRSPFGHSAREIALFRRGPGWASSLPGLFFGPRVAKSFASVCVSDTRMHPAQLSLNEALRRALDEKGAACAAPCLLSS